MRFDLLTQGIEIGLVTTNLDAMVTFYEGFLGLEFQAKSNFPAGRSGGIRSAAVW